VNAVSTVFFHGGRAGLKAGDRILPPSQTGFVRAQQVMREIGWRAPLGPHDREDPGVRARWWKTYALEDRPGYSPERVYVTSNLALARDHAAGAANWGQITGIPDPGRPAGLPGDAPVGHVYEVAGDFVPEYDFWPSGRCCCTRHGTERTCIYQAGGAVVVRPVYEVQAARTMTWRLVSAGLHAGYERWREEVSGRDWWDRRAG
jgi:hypothetical protein